MSEIDWMMPGVVAVYNSKTHPQCGKKCIIESVPFMRHCGNLVVQTTLFDTPEFACHFIPEGTEALTLPVGMLEALKRDSETLSKARAVLDSPENENALKKSKSICQGLSNFDDMTDGLEMAALIYFLSDALEAE